MDVMAVIAILGQARREIVCVCACVCVWERDVEGEQEIVGTAPGWGCDGDHGFTFVPIRSLPSTLSPRPVLTGMDVMAIPGLDIILHGRNPAPSIHCFFVVLRRSIIFIEVDNFLRKYPQKMTFILRHNRKKYLRLAG